MKILLDLSNLDQELHNPKWIKNNDTYEWELIPSLNLKVTIIKIEINKWQIIYANQPITGFFNSLTLAKEFTWSLYKRFWASQIKGVNFYDIILEPNLSFNLHENVLKQIDNEEWRDELG